MKANTAIGIGVTFAGLALGATMEGSKIPAFINLPAFLIVCVGTFGVALAGTGMDNFKKVPTLYKKAFGAERQDLRAQVELMVKYAEMARREGLLALEDQLADIDDEFTKKGLQLVVDGTDPELVREILENEMDAMEARHAQGAQPFEKAGGFAPTMGIIGTVMGLVHVLENLDQPETLGPAISGAFIATLYGVGSANVVFLPIANKLKYLSHEEMELRTLTLEGVLSIQAGDNPRVVESKLMAFVPPTQREAAAEAGAPARAGAEEPVAAAA
ncbi:MAG: flagellar motor protein [Thermoleophilaceae bacterium]